MTTLSVNLVPSEVAGQGPWAERLETILTTTLGGFLLVFVVLALIWLIFEALGKVFSKGTAKASVLKEEEELPLVKTCKTPAPAAPAVSSDEEIVAAIVAAISAYTGKPQSRFRVVSFRKKR